MQIAECLAQWINVPNPQLQTAQIRHVSNIVKETTIWPDHLGRPFSAQVDWWALLAAEPAALTVQQATSMMYIILCRLKKILYVVVPKIQEINSYFNSSSFISTCSIQSIVGVRTQFLASSLGIWSLIASSLARPMETKGPGSHWRQKCKKQMPHIRWHSWNSDDTIQ